MKIKLNKCYSCGGYTSKIKWIKDAPPTGDDLMRCPLCGAVEDGFSEIIAEVEDDD